MLLVDFILSSVGDSAVGGGGGMVTRYRYSWRLLYDDVNDRFKYQDRHWYLHSLLSSFKMIKVKSIL